MMPSRRHILGGGGMMAVALACPWIARPASGMVEIEMRGRDGGAAVWFDPPGLSVDPGATIRWINRDSGNAHTATAYHPAIGDRQRRLPAGAEPWDSGYLLPDDSFSVTLTVSGVYDYYCVPHEQAGMVGRIVVGAATGEVTPSADGEPPPPAALAAFPPVEEIVRRGVVRAD